MKRQLLFILASLLLSFTGFSQIPTSGLVGYYELDNGTYIDSSPSGFDLEVVGIGGILFPAQNRFGETDKAINFLNEYLDLASNPTAFDFDSDSNFSLCVWMKIGSNIADWTGLLNNWGAASGGYYLGINPTQGVRWNVNGPTPVDSATIPTDVWTHVAATYDGVDANLYIDGVLVGSEANNTPIVASPYPFSVASQSDLPTLQFPGILDEILVYDRVLTGLEIADIFIALSIQDIDAFSSQIKIYPNPVTSSLAVSYNKALGTIESYRLSDIEGRLIESNEFDGIETTINLHSVESGIYLLTLLTSDGLSIAKKIIKK